jgi:pyrrolidone-carboxylate peptidase
MNFIAQGNLNTRAGFIHLPYLHEQTANKHADMPGMSRETTVSAIKLAIETTIHL